MNESPTLRYYVAPDPQGAPEWFIYRGTSSKGGDVILTLPGSLTAAEAEKIRKAMANARSDGSREAWDEMSSLAQKRRLANAE